MKYDTKIREEELKHRVAADWFAAYDCARVIGNIDFAVDLPATELALSAAPAWRTRGCLEASHQQE